eukprot:2330134-Pyramimonas_sp.AAC.1
MTRAQIRVELAHLRWPRGRLPRRAGPARAPRGDRQAGRVGPGHHRGGARGRNARARGGGLPPGSHRYVGAATPGCRARAREPPANHVHRLRHGRPGRELRDTLQPTCIVLLPYPNVGNYSAKGPGCTLFSRQALRMMSQAGHVGKLVVRNTPLAMAAPGGALAVTGGTGGLGAVLALWAVERQLAPAMTLLGRSGRAANLHPPPAEACA